MWKTISKRPTSHPRRILCCCVLCGEFPCLSTGQWSQIVLSDAAMKSTTKEKKEHRGFKKLLFTSKLQSMYTHLSMPLECLVSTALNSALVFLSGVQAGHRYVLALFIWWQRQRSTHRCFSEVCHKFNVGTYPVFVGMLQLQRDMH